MAGVTRTSMPADRGQTADRLRVHHHCHLQDRCGVRPDVLGDHGRGQILRYHRCFVPALVLDLVLPIHVRAAATEAAPTERSCAVGTERRVAGCAERTARRDN